MKRSFINFLITTIVIIIAVSCKQPETIVVQSSPEVVAKNTNFTPKDTTDQSENILKYGELDPIESLDPLFARNAASQRLIKLIYEGLVDLNQNGQVIPALARSWEIGPDSLDYTFHLRSNDFFQDNECFTSGLGRRVTANDVKEAFDRMCLNTVPPNAAKLFMSIDGFDTYFKEQHEIFNTKFRTLHSIPGIVAQNDSTLRIELAVKDPHFLEKLASPYAVVYPYEALTYKSQGLAVNPVGSGPFEFNNSESDTLFVLKKNKNYWKRNGQGQKLPTLDEVDVVNIKNETELYRALAGNDLQYIPELGPDMIHMLIDQDGKLKSSFSSLFRLQQSDGMNQYILKFNPDNRYNISRDDAVYLTGLFNFKHYEQWLGNQTINLAYQAKPDNHIDGDLLIERLGKKNINDDYFTAAFSNDKQAYNFISTFMDTLNRKIKVQIVKSPVIGRNMTIYISHDLMYYPGQDNRNGNDVLLHFGIHRYAVANKDIKNIQLNQYEWWQNLDEVQTPPVNL